MAAFFDQMRKNPSELDGECFENFIRQLIAKELRQTRAQANENNQESQAIRNKPMNDHTLMANSNSCNKGPIRKDKEVENGSEIATKVDINRISHEMTELYYHFSEKTRLLSEQTILLANQI